MYGNADARKLLFLFLFSFSFSFFFFLVTSMLGRFGCRAVASLVPLLHYHSFLTTGSFSHFLLLSFLPFSGSRFNCLTLISNAIGIESRGRAEKEDANTHTHRATSVCVCVLQCGYNEKTGPKDRAQEEHRGQRRGIVVCVCVTDWFIWLLSTQTTIANRPEKSA